MYSKKNEWLIGEIKKLELPWTPYKPKEDVIKGIEYIDWILSIFVPKTPKNNASNIIRGMLEEYVFHFLHWLISPERQTSDVDSFEFLNGRPLGVVEYGGVKGLLKRRYAEMKNVSLWSFLLEFKKFVVYKIGKPHDVMKEFTTLKDFLEFWNVLEFED